MDRIWHSSLPDMRSFSGAECETDHCLVVVKYGGRLAVNAQSAQSFDG
jgi:hypothetical protein